MIKKKINILYIILGIILIMGIAIGLTFWVRSCNSNKFEKLEISAKNTWKVEQYFETLGKYPRNIPSGYSDEGLLENYPVYGTSMTITDDGIKTKLFEEDARLRASSTTYDSMDEFGNLYLNGVATGKKLYRHTSSKGMYFGDVSDNEPAVIQRVTLKQLEDRNYITGVYAPAGEVVKVEISSEDLEATGGLSISIGQMSHRNINNQIVKDRTNFTRMPNVGNVMQAKGTTTYVGNFLGGPIYIRAKNVGVPYTVTISGGVKYSNYIHGLTSRQEFESTTNSTAPFFDFEVWDKGVRHSGQKRYGNFDYDNLFRCGEFWKNVCLTSRLVPPTSNSNIGVCMLYDTHIWLPGALACAWQGPHTWANEPSSALSFALNYETLTYDGFWGIIHEFNHHYQNYGINSYGEVTNNATSLLSYISYTNISSRRSEDINSLGNYWNKFSVPYYSLQDTLTKGATAQTSVNIYADIMHTFGVKTYALATQYSAGLHTADDWFDAVCKATGYDMSYYFEKILGHTISDEIKNKYKGDNYPVFVPVANLYQTGRDVVVGSEKKLIKTVRPYIAVKGQELILDFEKYTSLPNGFDFTIKNITLPQNGTLTKVSDKKYTYIGNTDTSGEFQMTIGLSHETIKTPDITFSFEISLIDPKPTKTKYTYSSNLYQSVDDANDNNFEGYDTSNVVYENSTFLNGIGTKQIGVVEGKIYIPKDNDYKICLRAGRGKHALYVSTDGVNFEKVISFDGTKNTFDLDESHLYKISLKAGEYLWYKQVTISNNHSDAYTELGWTTSDSNPVTIPGEYLYNIVSGYKPYDFEFDSFLNKEYSKSDTLYISNYLKSKIVSSNQPAWDSTTSPDNIFDGNPDTYYHSNQNNFVSKDNPCEIVADFGETKLYNSLVITNRKINPAHMPTTFKLYGGESLDDMVLIGDYENLTFSGLSLQVNFDARLVRYIKLVITNTAALTGAKNKYVSIANLELRYFVSGIELSPDEMTYYGFEIDNSSFSTFGHLISGKGYVQYEFEGTDFVLYTKNLAHSKIKVEIDKNTYEFTLNQTNQKEIGVILTGLDDTLHKLKITVIEGTLSVDSLLVSR